MIIVHLILAGFIGAIVVGSIYIVCALIVRFREAFAFLVACVFLIVLGTAVLECLK